MHKLYVHAAKKFLQHSSLHFCCTTLKHDRFTFVVMFKSRFMVLTLNKLQAVSQDQNLFIAHRFVYLNIRTSQTLNWSW